MWQIAKVPHHHPSHPCPSSLSYYIIYYNEIYKISGHCGHRQCSLLFNSSPYFISLCVCVCVYVKPFLTTNITPFTWHFFPFFHVLNSQNLLFLIFIISQGPMFSPLITYEIYSFFNVLYKQILSHYQLWTFFNIIMLNTFFLSLSCMFLFLPSKYFYLLFFSLLKAAKI